MNLQKIIKNYIYRVNHSEIGNRIANGAFWSFSGTAIAKCIVLVAGIFCARILTKQEYGEFGLIRSTLNMFVVFGTAGMGVTATKYIAEFRNYNPEKIGGIFLLTNGFAITIGLLVTVLVVVNSHFIADRMLHEVSLAPSVRVGGILLFVTILNGAQSGTLSGFEDFKSIAINTFWGSICESAFMLIGAYYYGVFGALLGFGSGYVILSVLNYLSISNWLSRYGTKLSVSEICKKEYLELLYKFSLPAALSSMLVAPSYWIVRTLLAERCGFEEVAVFEAADQWRVIILFVPSAVSQIVLPILSSLSGGDKRKYWKVLRVNLILNASIAAVVSIIVIIASPLIMRLYGGGYVDDHNVLRLLAISTVFSSAANVVGNSIMSRAKNWVGLSFNLLWSIMFIGLTAFLLNRNYGAESLAIAMLFSYLIHTILQLCYLKVSVSKINN